MSVQLANGNWCESGSVAHREKLRQDNIKLYGEFMPHVKSFVITELDSKGYEIRVVKKLSPIYHEGDAIWQTTMMGWTAQLNGEDKRFHWRPYNPRRDN